MRIFRCGCMGEKAEKIKGLKNTGLYVSIDIRKLNLLHMC